jgi:hypothetical protein
MLCHETASFLPSIHPSIPSNSFSTSSPHHATPTHTYICTCTHKHKARILQNPDPTDRPMHLSPAALRSTKYILTTQPYIPAPRPSTQPLTQAVRTYQHHKRPKNPSRNPPFLPSLLLPLSTRPELGWLTRLASGASFDHTDLIDT